MVTGVIVVVIVVCCWLVELVVMVGGRGTADSGQ